MPPLRLGILIASLQVGGAERAALGLLDGLDAAGVEAFLLTLDRNREMVTTTDGGRRDRLLPRIIHLSGADIGWSTISKTLIAPWQWWKLERALRRLELDVVLSVVERANIMNLVTLAQRRRIISIRSYPSLLVSSKTPLKRALVLRLYRTLLSRADRIVLVSKEAALDFERLFPGCAGRLTVIYNACDAERIRAHARSPIPAEFEPLFEGPVVIACGRLKPEKGHWALLRAFAEVARHDGAVRLVVLGKGPLEPELLRLRDALGLRDRVFLPGFQSNPAAWIARSRLFVLPSVWEGFPNSLLEALAVGVPVVASDCRSGPRELLAPQSDPRVKTTEITVTRLGFLVPPPDGVQREAREVLTTQERLLGQAIERALRDDELRRTCPRDAGERLLEFAPERIIPRWLDLIGGTA